MLMPTRTKSQNTLLKTRQHPHRPTPISSLEIIPPITIPLRTIRRILSTGRLSPHRRRPIQQPTPQRNLARVLNTLQRPRTRTIFAQITRRLMISRGIRHALVQSARRVSTRAAPSVRIGPSTTRSRAAVQGALAAVLVAEFRPGFKVFEIHGGFGHEFKGAGGCSGGFTGTLFGHALHGVDVAEGSGVADVAVESAVVEGCEEVLGLFVDHGDGELLVESGVAVGKH